jgi:lipopolysaccharide export system permease protein
MFLLPRIIYRYLVLEILAPFFVSLLVFTALSFLGRLMKLTQLIVVKGVGMMEVLQACAYLLPYLLVFTLPMSAMVGILLALLRLSVDYEIMAMRTCGMSFVKLLPPVLAFSLAVAFTTLVLCVYVSPWGKMAGRIFLVEITKKRAEMVLREQVFNTEFNRMMVYVNRITPEKNLQGVLIHDNRDPNNVNTVYAEEGRVKFDSSRNSLVMYLQRGYLLQLTGKFDQWHPGEFQSYQIPLFTFGDESGAKMDDEMGLGELRRTLAAAKPGTELHNRLLIELNRRFAMPLGALLLCLIAMPLGLSPGHHSRTWGLIVALGVVLGYYIVFTASWRLAVNGQVHPGAAPWLPDLALAAVGALFWFRTVQELPLMPPAPAWLKVWKARTFSLFRRGA